MNLCTETWTSNTSQCLTFDLLPVDRHVRSFSPFYSPAESSTEETSVSTGGMAVKDKLQCDVMTYFVRQQLLHSVSRQPSGLQLFTGLGCSFSFHQSFCLSQEVRHQDLEHSERANTFIWTCFINPAQEQIWQQITVLYINLFTESDLTTAADNSSIFKVQLKLIRYSF